MALENINLGTSPTGEGGDSPREAFTKVNNNINKTVEGPSSATAGRVAVYDGTTGKLLQNGTKAEADLVVGPASATDNSVAVYDGTTGKLLKDGTGTVTAGKFAPTATTVTGNGMYLPATNAVAISTNGVERLRVLAGGNVGIGTATPARLLDVATDAGIHGVRVGRGGGDQTTNTAVGATALNNNTTGTTNTAIGTNALGLNTSAAGNTAIGRSALNANTSGSNNVSVGFESLNNNTSGPNNTAVGFEALRQFRSATGEQTAVGYRALRSAGTPADNTGNQNTAVGHQAGDGITTGSTNTIVGHNAGRSITTGSGNTVLGAGIAGSAALANTVLIGSSGAERMRIDSSGNVGIGTTSPAASLDVAGTGALKTPVGTDGQRPTPATGMLRYNSDAGSFEGYDAAAWRGIVAGPASATDGAVALYDQTTGKLLKNGPVPGAASGLATLDADTRLASKITARGGPAGGYMSPVIVASSTRTQAMINGTMFPHPWFLPFDLAIDRIVVEVTTAGASGSVVRLGVYTVGATGTGLSLLQDFGTIDGTVTGNAELTVSATLPQGLIYFVAVGQGAPATNPALRAVAETQRVPYSRFSTVGQPGGVFGGFTALATGITGALPSTDANNGSGTSGGPPLFAVRLA